MKTYIDMFETYKGLFMASKKLKNRFKKYWGTTTVDGVEVFNNRLVVWPNTEGRPNAIAILKMFGMYNNIKKAKFEGITSYYLWLNPAKMDDYSNISKDIVVNHLNHVIPNTEFEFTLNYTDMNDPKKFKGWTSEQISGWLLDNYATLKNSSFMESRGDTLVGETIGYYVPLDTAANFNSEVVEAMVTPIAYSTSAGLTAYRSGISVTIKCKQVSPLQENDYIVDLMLNETDLDRKRKITTVFGLTRDVGDEDAELEWDSSVDGIWAGRTDIGAGKTDKLWYKGYLRAAILDSSYLDRDSFAKVLAGAMDTGYKKKKTKWWKKLIAIVIVIVVVYLSWGAASGAAAAGSAAWLGAFAFYLGIGTLVMTALQYVIAKSGDTGWAQYFGNIVQIVSVVSMIAGIGAFMQNMAARVAAQQAAKQSLAQAASAAVKEAFTELATTAVKFAKDVSLGNALNFLGSKIVSLGRMMLEKLMDMRVSTAKKELGELQDAVQQSKEELTELMDREVHIGVEDIKYYTSPLKLDNLPFEVDYLYEGTKMNICRPSFVPTGLNIIDK